MIMQAGKNNLIWPKRITVCEVGPRDGLQNEKVLLTVEQKIELIERSTLAGAKIIEIGSFVHPKAVPPMANTDEVAKRMKRVEGVEYRALVMNLRGLERAEAAGITKAKLTVSASRTHSMKNLNKTPEEAVHGFAEYAEYAAAHKIELSGAISTAFGCCFEGRVPLEQVISVVKCFKEIGVNQLSLSDTTGMASPVIAGMLAGIDCYDACFAGLGGCPFAPGASGNIATEDLVHMLSEMGIDTGYDLVEGIAIGHRVREFVGHDTDSSILRAGRCSDIVAPQK